MNLNIADLTKDQQILTMARNEAIEALKNDSELQKHENQRLVIGLKALQKNKVNWSRIS